MKFYANLNKLNKEVYLTEIFFDYVNLWRRQNWNLT